MPAQEAVLAIAQWPIPSFLCLFVANALHSLAVRGSVNCSRQKLSTHQPNMHAQNTHTRRTTNTPTWVAYFNLVSSHSGMPAHFLHRPQRADQSFWACCFRKEGMQTLRTGRVAPPLTEQPQQVSLPGRTLTTYAIKIRPWTLITKPTVISTIRPKVMTKLAKSVAIFLFGSYATS